MKTLLAASLFTLLFSACSKYSAFADFHLTQNQERCEDSIQSAKINDKTGTVGLLSAIYLNRIYPQKYQDGEYFYIYFYTKGERKKLNFFLNKKVALDVQKLQATNQFSQLITPTQEWKEYYLVKFQKEKRSLTLRAKKSQLSSYPLLFQKNEK